MKIVLDLQRFKSMSKSERGRHVHNACWIPVFMFFEIVEEMISNIIDDNRVCADMTWHERIAVTAFCTFVVAVICLAGFETVRAVRDGYRAEIDRNALVRCLTDGGGC